MKSQKSLLRIADPAQERPHGVEAQFDAVRLKAVEILDDGGVSHLQIGGAPKAKNDSRGC